MGGRQELILGIESSCDETGCAVVAGGRDVRANRVASQVDLHARFGGVVPEVASRAHLEVITAIIDDALEESGTAAPDIAAVAVANEPGLIGSLLVGLSAAKALAWGWSKPLIGVNHIHAHACAPALAGDPVTYPAAALVCSGGHTSLYHCRGPADLQLLGATIDDAAGEAFDKVATILGLGYPGGPAVDRAAAGGDPRAVAFPRTLLDPSSLDFSFSGLKTAVRYHVEGVPGTAAAPGARRGRECLDDTAIRDIAASFQQAVVDVLIEKLRRAVERTAAASIIIGGGVAANTALRAAAAELARETGCPLHCPPPAYCTDNAAMIAALGWHHFTRGAVSGLDLAAAATIKR